MQGQQHFHPKKAVILDADQIACNFMDTSPGAKHISSDVEFQPSEVCPKNYIIFDRTDNRSQIMFNPAIACKLFSPGLNVQTSNIQGRYYVDTNDEKEMHSPLEEDSDYINALLSLEAEKYPPDVEESDDEISTAKTYGKCGSESLDSCSSFSSRPTKDLSSSSIPKLSGAHSSCCKSERKRQKMKMMVQALRAIVPDANQMDTAAVLDEAVRYLKSLKVEARKFGIEDMKN